MKFEKLFVISVFLFFISNWGFCGSVKKIDLNDYRLDSKVTEIAVSKCTTVKNDRIEYLSDGMYGLSSTEVEFYILGWSKDGKLAFFENRKIDGRGGCNLIFTILDTVEDYVCFNSVAENYEGELSEYIKANYEFYDEALKENKIILKACKFKELPVVYDKSGRVRFKVDVIKRKIGKYGMLEMSYDIQAINASGKSKVLNGERDALVNLVVPVGYLKSPYENRVALIVCSSSYVFEGSEFFLSFYGCNLKVGFK